MKRNYTIGLVAALLVLIGTTATAATRSQLASYASSLKGLKKGNLKTAVYKIMQPETVLSYGSGSSNTWWGFYYTDRIASTNECRNRYSSNKYYFSSTNTGKAIDGMNIEHSFPKSWWGGAKNNAHKDLFNLYPSETSANSSKGNYPMGVVTNVTSSSGTGYDLVGTGTIDGESGVRCWEPGNTWKGDFCRAYMYMATTYQNLTFTGTQGLQELTNATDSNGNKWPTLKEWAYTLYLQWNRNDPVDDIETARNEAIYKIQGNRNLFVDYPYLAEYIWGDSIDVPFDPASAITTATDDNRYPASETSVSRPTFTPSAGTYQDAQEITLACATAGATILYTTDGTTPSASNGTTYSQPFTIDQTTTVKAVAILNGEASSVATAVYTIGEASPEGTFTFKKVDTVTPGKRYLIVAELGGQLYAAIPVNAGRSFQYLLTSEVTATDNVITLQSDTLAYTIDEGYTIVDTRGRYYYQSESYKTINAAASNNAYNWVIQPQSDGTFVISMNSYSWQYNSSYSTFGLYTDEQGTRPSLYEETTGNPDPEPEPDDPDDPDEPSDGTFTLVTSADQIVAGYEYVLVYNNGDESYVMGAQADGHNYISAIEATVSQSTITPPAGAVVLTLAGSEGAWTLESDEGCLYTQATKNLIYSASPSTWSIEAADEGYVLATASAGTVYFNTSVPCFRNYASQGSMQPAVLFYRKGGTNAIGSIEAEPSHTRDTYYYDLAGRRYDRPAASGVYIHQGRKILVR